MQMETGKAASQPLAFLHNVLWLFQRHWVWCSNLIVGWHSSLSWEKVEIGLMSAEGICKRPGDLRSTPFLLCFCLYLEIVNPPPHPILGVLVSFHNDPYAPLGRVHLQKHFLFKWHASLTTGGFIKPKTSFSHRSLPLSPTPDLAGGWERQRAFLVLASWGCWFLYDGRDLESWNNRLSLARHNYDRIRYTLTFSQITTGVQDGERWPQSMTSEDDLEGLICSAFIEWVSTGIRLK